MSHGLHQRGAHLRIFCAQWKGFIFAGKLGKIANVLITHTTRWHHLLSLAWEFMSPNSNEMMSDLSLYKGVPCSFGPTYTQPFNEETLRRSSKPFQQADSRNTPTEVTSTRQERYNPKILTNVKEYNLLWNNDYIRALSTLTICKHRELLLNSLREFMYWLWRQRVRAQKDPLPLVATFSPLPATTVWVSAQTVQQDIRDIIDLIDNTIDVNLLFTP